MQTIHLQVQDSLYEQLIQSGVNIQEKLNDFLYEIVDDGYPSIGNEEAKKRVSDAVQRYKDGTGVYTSFDGEYISKLNNHIERI
ncbi:MAG: hypothetical protein RBT59_08540 [Arcobacteraceae bacterium]|jgi:hypothetical protein|nr:hypothetical protein [Arcobacteraceae bacterium]